MTISLFRRDKEIAQFQPQFTYPIFGEEEAVFGYKGLDISLTFNAHDLKPHVDISWEEQWKQQGDIKASDIRGALEEFLPESAFADGTQTQDDTSDSAADFTPPGTRVRSYRNSKGTFEIWCTTLADPLAREMMQNAQVLVPLFIEGGTELDFEHDWVNERWKVFLLYQILDDTPKASRYSVVGFATSYRVFTLPNRWDPSAASLALIQHDGQEFDSILGQSPGEDVDKSAHSPKSPLDLPSRERISQFIILPPYQASGHGAQLYNTMYTHLSAPENVLELTVEDPNEAFDDMRDACDVWFLRESNDDFASLAINPKVDVSKLKPTVDLPTSDIVDGAVTSRIKSATKIMPRQFARLLEMQTLSKIPLNHRSVNRISRKEKSSNEMDRAYFYWRLFVKQRLYQANRDVLSAIETQERIEKLEATVDVVQDDYARLLSLADRVAKHALDSHIITSPNQERRSRKRKVVESDEDEDDEEDDGVEADGEAEASNLTSSGTKKRKVAVR